jgi:hypothetical protein
MCANSTGSTQAFLSASDAAVSEKVADCKISIQSACALNTLYILMQAIVSLKAACAVIGSGVVVVNSVI